MNFERIDKYLANEMSSFERKQFEEEIATNEELKKEIQVYQGLINGLKRNQREDLKKRLVAREKKKSGSWNSILLIIAGILCLIFFVYFIVTRTNQTVRENGIDLPLIIPVNKMDSSETDKFTKDSIQQNSKKIGEQLFAMYYKPYQDELLVSVSRGEGELDPLENFQQKYIKGQFKEAIRLYETLDPSLRGNDNNAFIYSNALMAANRISEASTSLEEIIHRNKTRYIKEAYLNLALCEIKEGQLDEARNLLSSKYLKNNNIAVALIEKIK